MTRSVTSVNPTGSCPYCSGGGHYVYHSGGICPRIRAIEYYPDGTVKGVEFQPELPLYPAPARGKAIMGHAPIWDWEFISGVLDESERKVSATPGVYTTTTGTWEDGFCSDCNETRRIWWEPTGDCSYCQPCGGSNVRPVEEEMMRGKGYCSDCGKEVEVEYCKYWWRDGSPAANDPFHKICCECGGSNVEFLVGPLAINTNISVVMKKLGVIWHGLNKHCQCQYSFAQTLALILPSALGDVAFGDEEFSAAMDEVLASWDNAE